MRVLVCGSRTWDDADAIREALSDDSITTVIHGAAAGADSIANAVAQELDLEIEAYPADWEFYGKSAGYIRNVRMLDAKPDKVIAFRGAGESRGTDMMIRIARAAGVPVDVHTIGG